MRWIGCQRFIYNAKVQDDRYFRTFVRKSLQLVGQYAPIDQTYSQYKAQAPFLKEVPSQILRNGAVRWRDAYSRFFARLGDVPKSRNAMAGNPCWSLHFPGVFPLWNDRQGFPTSSVWFCLYRLWIYRQCGSQCSTGDCPSCCVWPDSKQTTGAGTVHGRQRETQVANASGVTCKPGSDTVISRT